MPLSTSYDVYSGDKSTLAKSIDATTTTEIKAAAMSANGSTTSWFTPAGVAEMREELDGVVKVEWFSYTSITTNSDNSVTFNGVSRDVARDGSSLTGSGTGQTFNKGSEIRLVAHHILLNKKANVDRSNTFTEDQTISSGKKIFLGGPDAYIYSNDSGTNITLKDASNPATTLTQLAALSGTDTKARITASDTTSGFLNGKLTAGAGVTLTVGSPGANETLAIAATNTVATGHTGLSSVTSGGLLIGAGTSNMTVIGPGSSGQVPISNGTTIAMGNPTKKFDVVLMSATSSTGVGDNSTTENNIGTYTYTIPENDLVDGVRYVIDVSGTLTYADATNDPTFRVKLGSTTIASTAMTNIGSTISVHIRAYVYGTAAAGGSVTVRGGITVIAGSGTATGADIGVGDGSASVATNGTLVLQLSQQNSVSGTPYNIVLKSGTITKESSTAF